MKQASVRCPHCGASFTVRQINQNDLSAEQVSKIWKAFDEVSHTMDKAFAKLREVWK